MTVKNTGGLSNSARNPAEPVPEPTRDPGYGERDQGDGLDPESWTRIEMDGSSEAIDPAELKEFLEGDWTHIQADPGFKERLRAELWRMVTALPTAKKNK
ncbi:MAG: hypothetical protein VX252_06055 [Myxococcota bacterium]|nr:hypothetical protein [Myxococcota bacterium]